MTKLTLIFTSRSNESESIFWNQSIDYFFDSTFPFLFHLSWPVFCFICIVWSHTHTHSKQEDRRSTNKRNRKNFVCRFRPASIKTNLPPIRIRARQSLFGFDRLSHSLSFSFCRAGFCRRFCFYEKPLLCSPCTTRHQRRDAEDVLRSGFFFFIVIVIIPSPSSGPASFEATARACTNLFPFFV